MLVLHSQHPAEKMEPLQGGLVRWEQGRPLLLLGESRRVDQFIGPGAYVG
jgi:hypothetical protein